MHSAAVFGECVWGDNESAAPGNCDGPVGGGVAFGFAAGDAGACGRCGCGEDSGAGGVACGVGGVEEEWGDGAGGGGAGAGARGVCGVVWEELCGDGVCERSGVWVGALVGVLRGGGTVVLSQWFAVGLTGCHDPSAAHSALGGAECSGRDDGLLVAG